ncbi:MAG: polyisoprenoid-binding protein YceI [Polyangiales bacterium]|jgi:polyisoprenoid-binding protein YceI
MKWDGTGVTMEVFTYKDGLLSKIAHDLRIVVPNPRVQFDGESIKVRIDLRNLQVASAQTDGRDDPSLSDGDKKKILKGLNKEALRTDRHPEAIYEAKARFPDQTSAELEGKLTLHGTTRDLRISLVRKDERWCGEVLIHQPDFGIKPYTAMFGALKVKPDVRVTFSAAVTA